MNNTHYALSMVEGNTKFETRRLFIEKLIAIIITLSLVLSMSGCLSSQSSTLKTEIETRYETKSEPRLVKQLASKVEPTPEEVVSLLFDTYFLNELLDNMINSDSLKEYIDNPSIYDRLFYDVKSFPSWEKLLRNNVEIIEYGVSNVTISGDKATVKTIITFYDINPVIKETFDLLYDKAEKIESSKKYKNASEEEKQNLVSELFYESFSEALKTTKTPETFTKIRFSLVNERGKWELNTIPEDFFLSVLFCNLDNALDENITQFQKRLRES